MSARTSMEIGLERDANGNNLCPSSSNSNQGFLTSDGKDSVESLELLTNSVQTLLAWKQGQFPAVSYEPNVRACYKIVMWTADPVQVLLTQLTSQLKQHLNEVLVRNYDRFLGQDDGLLDTFTGEMLLRTLNNDVDAYCTSVEMIAPLFQPLCSSHIMPFLAAYLRSQPADTVNWHFSNSSIFCRSPAVCPSLAENMAAIAADIQTEHANVSADADLLVVDDVCINVQRDDQNLTSQMRKRPCDSQNDQIQEKIVKY